MGLSNYLPTSAIAKPGVCTSSTRPASPYEGQVIYETDTDKTLVWNGSAWVYLSTSTANPPGLELITSCTASSAGGTASATASGGVVTIGTANTSVTVSNAFSSSYDNYQILLDTSVSANQPAIHLLLGSDTTGYSYGGYYIGYTIGTLSGAASSNAAQWIIGDAGNATNIGINVILNGPNLSRRTFMQSASASTAWSNTYNGMMNTSTSYTAFTIRASTGSISGGTIRVYGYRN